MPTICVFLGSTGADNSEFCDAAKQLGHEIAEQGYTLVYGGTKIGLMGILADAALQANGKVIGVINRDFAKPEVLHDKLADLQIVDTMSQRLEVEIEISDVFIAFPGGVGTIDELTSVWAKQKAGIPCMNGKHIAVLNVNGIFTELLDGFQKLEYQGLMKPGENKLLTVESTPIALLAAIGKKLKLSQKDFATNLEFVS